MGEPALAVAAGNVEFVAALAGLADVVASCARQAPLASRVTVRNRRVFPFAKTELTFFIVTMPLYCKGASTVELSQTLGGRNDVSQTDAEFVVDDHHLALGNQVAVYQHIHRFSCKTIQFNDGTLRKLKYVLNRYLRPTQLNSQLNRDIQDHVDVVLSA